MRTQLRWYWNSCRDTNRDCIFLFCSFFDSWIDDDDETDASVCGCAPYLCCWIWNIVDGGCVDAMVVVGCGVCVFVCLIAVVWAVQTDVTVGLQTYNIAYRVLWQNGGGNKYVHTQQLDVFESNTDFFKINTLFLVAQRLSRTLFWVSIQVVVRVWNEGLLSIVYRCFPFPQSFFSMIWLQTRTRRKCCSANKHNQNKKKWKKMKQSREPPLKVMRCVCELSGNYINQDQASTRCVSQDQYVVQFWKKPIQKNQNHPTPSPPTNWCCSFIKKNGSSWWSLQAVIFYIFSLLPFIRRTRQSVSGQLKWGVE